MLPLYDVCTVYHGTNLFAAKIIRGQAKGET